LIALLDALHEASIAGMQPKPPPELAQTSFIYRIFGGRMRSQVGVGMCMCVCRR
jgi:ubiquitin carboxyl-terminal hydrolase 36/42